MQPKTDAVALAESLVVRNGSPLALLAFETITDAYSSTVPVLMVEMGREESHRALVRPGE